MKLVQVYYPPEVKLLQTLFHACLLPVRCCNDYCLLSHCFSQVMAASSCFNAAVIYI